MLGMLGAMGLTSAAMFQQTPMSLAIAVSYDLLKKKVRAAYQQARIGLAYLT